MPSPGGISPQIVQFAPLLAPLDLASCVITLDVLHAQRERAEHLVTDQEGGLHPGGQGQPARPARRAAETAVKTIPVTATHHNRGHRRREQRILRAVTVTAGWPS
jgi:hypothetical protein